MSKNAIGGWQISVLVMICVSMAFIGTARGKEQTPISREDWNQLPVIELPDKCTTYAEIVWSMLDKKAHQFMREKKYDAALKEYEAMLEKFTSYPLVIALAEGGIGTCYVRMNEVDRFISLYKSMQEKYKGYNDDLLIFGFPMAYSMAITDINIGEMLALNGRRDEALDHYTRGLRNEEAAMEKIRAWPPEMKEKLSSVFIDREMTRRETKKEAEKIMQQLRNASANGTGSNKTDKPVAPKLAK